MKINRIDIFALIYSIITSIVFYTVKDKSEYIFSFIGLSTITIIYCLNIVYEAILKKPN